MRRPCLTARFIAVTLAGFLFWPVAGVVRAQDAADVLGTPSAEEAAPAAGDDQPLSARQAALVARYQRFEKTLLQMSEYMRKTDPGKAELLVRAISQSKKSRVTDQMREVLRILEQPAPAFGEAINRQEELVVELRSILQLLQSEDRLDELEKERQRIQDLLKNITRLLVQEKDIRAGTQRGEDTDRLANRQEGVAKEAKNLTEKIDGQDAERNGQQGNESSDSKNGKGKQGDSKQSDGEQKDGDESKGEQKDGEESQGPDGEQKDGEQKDAEQSESGKGQQGKNQSGKSQQGKNGSQGEQSDQEKSDEEQSDSEKQDGEESEQNKSDEQKSDEQKSGKNQSGKQQSGKQQSGKQQSGQQQSGQQQQNQQQQQGQQQQGQQNQQQQRGQQQQQSDDQQQQKQRTPGRDEIERALREMERAIEELRKKNRDGASDAEDQAIAELLKAKEKLEEVLRQLREEERELLLAALEARFQKMLAMQVMVYNGTVSIDKTPKEQWAARQFGRARELSQQENEIAVEAARALTLLMEDGSSVAFPEAIEQLREDMLTVARRLGENDAGELTQMIEQDIIEALQEVVEALQKELEKIRQQRQQQQQQQQQQGDPELIDQLAELKMLRSLQYRVNRRTRQLGMMIEGDGEQATDADLIGQLQGLSRRQARIQDATYKLATGRAER